MVAVVFCVLPVADLIWSMGRRLRHGVSPLNPDNQHFHNVLFAYLDAGEQSSVRANTFSRRTCTPFPGLRRSVGQWPPASNRETLDLWARDEDGACFAGLACRANVQTPLIECAPVPTHMRSNGVAGCREHGVMLARAAQGGLALRSCQQLTGAQAWRG